MLDAGLSLRELTARMAFIGRSPEDLDALFITHEHSDHVRGVGSLVRKHNIPLYSTQGTYKRIKDKAGRIPVWNPIRDEEPVNVGELSVEPYSTVHDAEESVAFVLRNGSLKLGHATDLGKVTARVREKLRCSDTLLVEANHDPDMLDAGPYPWPVKQRIKSDVGHLSNEACADLLASVSHADLRRVVLMHLSQSNNHPDIAYAAVRQALDPERTEVLLSHQDRPTELIQVG